MKNYRLNNPTRGDQRIIYKFLFWPKTLRVGNTENYETRWFRKNPIIQSYESYDYYLEYSGKFLYTECEWEDLCWAENDIK